MTRTRETGADIIAASPVGEVVIRAYREGDEAAIRELFQRSFGQPLSSEAWSWRYRDHPLGGCRITVAHAADGTLLGHYGGYPVEWRHPSQTARLRSHQNGDVMTARSTRRLGRGESSVLGRMAAHYWATYGTGHVDFHYGVNTDTARDLQLRIVPGVRVVEPVTTWIGGAIAAPAGELQVERITSFTAEWDAFVDRVAPQYPLMTARDARVMNWRYLLRPGAESIALIARDRNRRIVGGSVFRVAADEAQWGDALFDLECPPAVIAVLAYLRSSGAPPRVLGWFAPRPDRWVQSLRLLGFQPAHEPRGLTLVYSPFTAAAEDLVPGLFYAWGDSDLF